jgi:hypothetical protein
MSEMVTLECSGCGKSFDRLKWRYELTLKRIPAPENFYCGHKCRGDFNNKLRTRISNWEQRFLSKIDKTPGLGPNQDCWEWRGHINEITGYAQFYMNKRNRMVHRVSYEYFNKCIVPEDLFIIHSCDNRICVNPDHLSPGTHQENMEDMVGKGRSAKGEKIGVATLTEEKVKDIRRLYATGEYTIAALGVKFETGHSNISQIVKRKSWKHVE